MTQTTPSQAVEAAAIAHLPQELKSLRDQLHRAYGHLPSDVFPGPPGSILGRLEAAAATIESALRAELASPQEVVRAEPVAWRRKESGWWVYYESEAYDDLEPLYTEPAGTVPLSQPQESCPGCITGKLHRCLLQGKNRVLAAKVCDNCKIELFGEEQSEYNLNSAEQKRDQGNLAVADSGGVQVPLSVECALWTIKEWALLHLGPMHNITIAANSAHAVCLSAPAQPTSVPGGTVAQGEPVAWAVWWGIGRMQKNSVHFERETAEGVAATIKSVTEIRPLYATPANMAVGAGGSVGAIPDDGFRGDNASLCRNIKALLSLDAAGAVAPHGIGGHDRTLLAAAASRLNLAPEQANPENSGSGATCGGPGSVHLVSGAGGNVHAPGPTDAGDGWFKACVAASKAVRPSICGHEWSAGFISGALWRPVSQPKPPLEDAECPHGKAYLVEGCLRCGAPLCCGRCCVEDELRQVHPGEVAYQLTKRLTVDMSTARAAVDAAILSSAPPDSEVKS